MLGATGGVVADQLVLTEVGPAPWDELLAQVAAGHGYRAGAWDSAVLRRRL
jgi:hypothetical protein